MREIDAMLLTRKLIMGVYKSIQNIFFKCKHEKSRVIRLNLIESFIK